MKAPAVLALTATCFVAPAWTYQTPPAPAAPQPQSITTAADASAVMQKYCVSCHNQRAKVAGLTLDTIDLKDVHQNAEVWEHVARKVRTGAMPPVGRPRPDKATAQGLVTWLEGELDRAAAVHVNPGRPSLQRLNRNEYRNAIRDLLALEIDVASMLPADGAGHGFDNNADALTLSSSLTERYLGAAAKISQMALSRPRGLPTPETYFVPTDRDQSRRVSDDMPLGSRGGLAVRHYFPADGEYLVELRPKESGVAGGFVGITAEPHQLDVSINNVVVKTVILGGPEFGRGRGAAPAANEYENVDRDKKIAELLTFRVPVKAGLHLVQAYFVPKTSSYVEDLFDPSLRREPYRGNAEPRVSTMTITGPQPNTASVGETASRRRILTCAPASPQDEDCARKIISTLARRAYRRPVTDADMKVPLGLYRDGAKRVGFETGIEMALRSILVSPTFLFRLEDQPSGVKPNTPYRISDLDLASRLSFFIWSSIPDEPLLEVAAKGNLRKPDVLLQQVRRMLADSRSEALVDNFAGQWLHIRNIGVHQPSPEVLFHFDDNLRKAFEEEMKLFFESIIRENRNVVDLLDTNYTFLNERLARHYGITGVYGERFRRVTLPSNSVRGGLLGKGSVLTTTSYPNRTSPVIRGKWILENVFGAPPPPPPPNVPELKDDRDPRKVLPMREQLAAHRKNPACAGCHAQMDQLGFALENFDGIGEWRDVYASGARVDASAELPDGTKFNGPVELRKVLREHSDQFLTTMIEKMLTYALGRGLEANDAPAVRSIKRASAKDNNRFESIIHGIVTSTPFTMRMAVEEAN